MSRYVVAARFWDGTGWEYARKEVTTKKEAIAALQVLIDNAGPYQLSFTDTEQLPNQMKVAPNHLMACPLCGEMVPGLVRLGEKETALCCNDCYQDIYENVRSKKPPLILYR